jgi:ubiquinone/menaquinone biosynthesis C-methylase UbiE
LTQKGSVERFFSQHAVDYSKSQSHASGSDLQALLKALKPKKSEVALDVATGTGFTAVALARLVGHVIGIDVTDEMLGQARMLATKEDAPSVRFELGDAMKIDYASSTFDIVTTRRAAHHFDNVPKFLREAKRVLRPGGRLGVVDMSPPEGAETFSNKIEWLRDKSHTEAFTPSSWKSMVSRAGFRILSADVLGDAVTFQRWLYPVEPGGPEEEAIRSAWGSASPRVKKLLEAKFEGEAIKGWTKNRIVLIASKAQ